MKLRTLPIVIASALGSSAFLLLKQGKGVPREKLIERFGQAPSQFIEINGSEIHYRDEGTGPTLILLHGLSSSLHTWDAWVEELKPFFRIIRMDVPGFGLSTPYPGFDFKAPNFPPILKAFADKLGLTDFSIAGNSMGGWFSWNCAVQMPNRINKLILINSVGYPLTGVNSLVFQLTKIPGARTIAKNLSPKFITKRTLKEIYGNKALVNEELIDHYHQINASRMARASMIDCVRLNFGEGCERIKEIKVPTLIQWGTEDIWIPIDHAHRFAKRIEGSKLQLYPGIGHVPMEESPEQTALDARNFLMA